MVLQRIVAPGLMLEMFISGGGFAIWNLPQNANGGPVGPPLAAFGFALGYPL
jgi:hypothetical protein